MAAVEAGVSAGVTLNSPPEKIHPPLLNLKFLDRILAVDELSKVILSIS